MYRFQIVGSGEGDESIVIIASDGDTRVLNANHPNFYKVWEALTTGFPDEVYSDDYTNSEGVEEAWLLDQAGNILVSASKQIVHLSERITCDGHEVFFDGDPINTNLSRHLLRTYTEGADSRPVALFMENLAQNPSATSRHRLWRWMDDRDFTLTDDGMIVGYKGVQAVDENLSISSGRETVFVDGEQFVGHIPNPVGAVVEMARGQVDPDINRTCSVGLHVGTYDYARRFGARVLTVLVNPRDIVEVPTDCNGQKIRTCRYVVVEDGTTQELDEPVFHVTEEQVTSTRGSDTWEDEPDLERDC